MGDLFSDGVTDIDAASLNQLVRGAGGKTGITVNYGLLARVGGVWQIYSVVNSCGILNPIWNAGLHRVEFTITGFSAIPAFVTGMDIGSGYNLKVGYLNSSTAYLKFYNMDTGALITAEDNSMFAQILLIGV